jgi:glutamyl-tRNA reductase
MSKDLVVYGISHHKAPVSVREKLAATPEQASAELSALRQTGALGEGVLLSTCNRVELIGTAAWTRCGTCSMWRRGSTRWCSASRRSWAR